VDKVFDVLIFLASIGFVVGGIDVDDFECDNLVGLRVTTVESSMLACGPEIGCGRAGKAHFLAG